MKTLGTHNYFVYILTNKNKTVLYTGVTNNLQIRIYWHMNPGASSKHFTTKYNCVYLIYFERFQYINQAIEREKQIKGLSRKKKEMIINSVNPEWNFLNDTIWIVITLLWMTKLWALSFRGMRNLSSRWWDSSLRSEWQNSEPCHSEVRGICPFDEEILRFALNDKTPDLVIPRHEESV